MVTKTLLNPTYLPTNVIVVTLVTVATEVTGVTVVTDSKDSSDRSNSKTQFATKLKL